MSRAFDHIIVGAGSAGCAVVACLAELTADQVCGVEPGSWQAVVWISMPVGHDNLMDGARVHARKEAA